MPFAVADNYGCVLWIGTRNARGYGVVRFGLTAHVAAWEAINGPIPVGMELDHECRRRACCNVDHLTVVTRRENERRKSWRYRVRLERCKRGHDMRVHAIVTPEGGRVCRACNRLAIR